MATLPGASGNSNVGITITTVADPAGIEATQASLAGLQVQAEETQGAITAEGEAGVAAADEQASATEAMAAKATVSSTSLASSLKSTGESLSGVGRTISTYVTLPVAGIAYEAVKSAMSFQTQMNLIQTQAGDTTDSLSWLSNQVLQLSQNSMWTPDQLAAGLYHLTSVGLRGADAINALNSAQQLAAVGGANLEDTTNAVAVAWKSGISGAQSFGDAAASLNAIVGAGNMRMNDLVAALGPTGLLAAGKAAGLTLNDVGAAEALLADMTGNAQTSAQHLRQALLLMQSPSTAAQKALASIGISSNQLGVDLQEGGIQQALGDVNKHLNDTFGPTAATSVQTYMNLLQTQGPAAADAFANSSANAASTISKAFGGSRSSSVIMQLLGGYDSGSFTQKLQSIQQSTNNFAQDYKTKQSEAQYQFDHALAQVMTDLTKLGQTIMPEVTNVVNDGAKAVNNITNWFDHLSKGQKQFVVDALGIVAISGPLLMFFGGVAKGISGIIELATGPFGVAMKAMGTAAFNAADQIIANMTGGVGIKMAVQNLVTYVGGPAALAGWAVFGAAAVAAFILIQNSANQTKKVIDQMQQGINADFASINNAISTVSNLAKTGTPAQQARAKALLASGSLAGSVPSNNSSNVFSDVMAGLKSLGFATGTNYAPGGWSMVGENGPEPMYVPQGAMIKTNAQMGTMHPGGLSSGGVTIYQTVNNYSNADMTEANRNLAFQLSGI
ncbi:MAG TPA: phage tail tape measure protein [Ktedonobacteraceae bacterium]|nr:phage tail tape measure protein [Ktedonobacteraceae bacterium]